MGQTTEISWTDATFNPWWGCTKVSPACDNCYADTFAKRVGFSESGSKFPIWGKDAERRFFGDGHWNEPLKWDRKAAKEGKRLRVFCGSMCDVMEDREDLQDPRVRLYNLISDTPNLDWLLLTKRPQNFRRFLPAAWIENPRPNVWGMTTVESADYLWRVDELLKTPFVVRGLSVEPLLGPLDLCLDGPGFDWIIVGGESGPGARPMHPGWARSLRNQCVAAGVPFFFKQWGNFVGGSCDRNGWFYPQCGPDGGRPGSDSLIEWGGGVASDYVRDKKAAGCLLDGREWKQFPEVPRG